MLRSPGSHFRDCLSVQPQNGLLPEEHDLFPGRRPGILDRGSCQGKNRRVPCYEDDSAALPFTRSMLMSLLESIRGLTIRIRDLLN